MFWGIGIIFPLCEKRPQFQMIRIFVTNNEWITVETFCAIFEEFTVNKWSVEVVIWTDAQRDGICIWWAQ